MNRKRKGGAEKERTKKLKKWKTSAKECVKLTSYFYKKDCQTQNENMSRASIEIVQEQLQVIFYDNMSTSFKDDTSFDLFAENSGSFTNFCQTNYRLHLLLRPVKSTKQLSSS